MTIERVDVFVLSHPLSEPLGTARRWLSRRSAVVVRLLGADGSAGWGECRGAPEIVAPLLRDFLAPRLVGQEALTAGPVLADLETRCREQGGGPLFAALAGLDMAWWDLRARLLGVPLATLLGGRPAAGVTLTCAPLPYPRGADQDQRLAAWARAAADEGVTDIGLKVGADRARDLANVRAVRRAVGPDATLGMDADGCLGAARAVELGLHAAVEGVAWFAEPVDADDHAGRAAVHAALSAQGVTVAAGAGLYDPRHAAALCAGGGVDVVLADPSAAGGLSGLVRLAALADAHHVELRLAGGGSAVATAARLAAIGGLGLAAQLPWEWGEQPLRDDIAEDFPRRDGARLAAPDGPGLGVTFEVERLAHYA
jgi:L-alanine-DL-glutamate epimerase-like enolase superfamily enzyme